MAKTLNDLFCYLDALGQRAPLPELLEEMRALQVDLRDLAPHVRFSDQKYRRNLVRGTDWYNLWVLCWRNGQRSPIHDHRGSSCAVRVLRGTMTESQFVFAPNGHVKPTLSRDLAPGAVVGSEDTDMHQVSNLQ